MMDVQRASILQETVRCAVKLCIRHINVNPCHHIIRDRIYVVNLRESTSRAPILTQKKEGKGRISSYASNRKNIKDLLR